jgi:hypothetical protein
MITSTRFMQESQRTLIAVVTFALINLFVLDVAHAQVPAARRIWTTVGSAGTVDEADRAKVTLSGSKVQIGTPPPPTTTSGPGLTSTPAPQQAAALAGFPQATSAVIRYNVTPVDGIYAFGADAELELRYLDVGVDAQVVVHVIEVDLATATETALVTFDSNTVTPANGYRVQSITACGGSGFDFRRKAYYVEARLTHNTLVVGSAAGIQIIKVKSVHCP